MSDQPATRADVERVHERVSKLDSKLDSLVNEVTRLATSTETRMGACSSHFDRLDADMSQVKRDLERGNGVPGLLPWQRERIEKDREQSEDVRSIKRAVYSMVATIGAAAVLALAGFVWTHLASGGGP
ncbi:MAG: hypothetical protein V2J24_01315 [Pseudomonadales bacterium]|jgi:hypothetical protein|nr:hypothetical protein [Pseudomonadales bacterium]